MISIDTATRLLGTFQQVHAIKYAEIYVLAIRYILKNQNSKHLVFFCENTIKVELHSELLQHTVVERPHDLSHSNTNVRCGQ